MARPLVRVDFGDEDAWGEHVEGNVYPNRRGVVRALFVIGEDMSPREE